MERRIPLEQSKIKASLAEIVGEENVLSEEGAILVCPISNEEIGRILQRADQDGFQVAVIGGGSTGNRTTPHHVKISLTRMNKILELDRDNMVAVVQAGMITADFQEELLAQGLYFPPDPLSRRKSTLGANVATRAYGPTIMSHGETVDFLLGLTAVLPDGKIFSPGGKNYKDVTAFDLNRIFGGSHGRLGIITQLIFRLLPKPEVFRTLVLNLPTMKEAAEIAAILTSQGIIPGKLEVLDGTILSQLENRRPQKMSSQGVVLIEVEGYQESIDHQVDLIQTALGGQGKALEEIAPDEAGELWQAREELAWFMYHPHGQMYSFAIKPTLLPATVEIIKEAGQAMGQPLGLVIHGTAGRLHPICFAPMDEDKLQVLTQDLTDKITELGGRPLKTQLNLENHEEKELITSLLKVFDPKGILAG